MNLFITIVFIFISLLLVSFVLIETVARPSLKHIFFGVVAAIMGLLMGSLLADPLSKLPGVLGQFLPITVSCIFALASILIYRRYLPQVDAISDETFLFFKKALTFGTDSGVFPTQSVVMDSSALIDGRIVDVIKLGFLSPKVVVPKFVLKELQNIADSKEHERREKGRRGLTAIDNIRKKLGQARFSISKDDFLDVATVDLKLIELSKKLGASLVTTDYNLNKVAAASGVSVLNVNELSQSLRPNLIPGTTFELKVVHLGKDKTQGVGYLEDGTMIVVERAGTMLGKSVKVEISRVLQTAAGKMYFAKVINGKN